MRQMGAPGRHTVAAAESASTIQINDLTIFQPPQSGGFSDIMTSQERARARRRV